MASETDKTSQEKETGKSTKSDLPILSFETQKDWEFWLSQNYDLQTGVWIRFFKKGSGISSIVYDQALDGALCYGWIDGQLKKLDENSYIQKFTPRRTKSMWSKRNIDHVSRLEKEGKMQSSGIREVENAKKDGRWERAYDSPGKMEIPEDFIQELSKNENALEFFESLNKVNKYSIGWRLQTAKSQETREKRIKEILAMMGKDEKFH